MLGGQSKRWAAKWAEQVGYKYSPDTAVGSSDHPVLVDERATTEVEAIAVLESGVRVRGELRLYVGMKHSGPYPTLRVCVPAGKPARARSLAQHSPR